MCDKAVITYPSTIQFVPECCKTQEAYDKAVNRCSFCICFYSSLMQNSRNVWQS